MSSELCFYVWLLKRDKMIRDNIGLVPFTYDTFFRHSYHPELMEDITQIGYSGLMRAVDKFDESRNVKFSVFAIKVIKQFMIQGAKQLTYALCTRDKRNGEIGKSNALPFSYFETQDKQGHTINIIETNYYEDEDIEIKSATTSIYIKYKNSLSGLDLAVLERLEKGMRQVDIAKELRISQKNVSKHKRKMQKELKVMLL